MNQDLTLFDFHFEDRNGSRTLLLLHGTGADKYDLLPLAERVAPDYNVLSLNGNVMEGNMRRFFVRTSEGVFDQESIRQEAEKLHHFMMAWQANYPKQQFSWLGYSNGATMILATLFLYSQLIDKAVLLHPMLPFVPSTTDFSGKSFLVSYGENDQMIPADWSLKALSLLEEYGASVTMISHEGGHEIREVELEVALQFLVKQ